MLVVDNAMYGTIRMHQERAYPGRVIATGLENPDFAALAEAYGAAGETVAATAGVPAALDRALEAGPPGRARPEGRPGGDRPGPDPVGAAAPVKLALLPGAGGSCQDRRMGRLNELDLSPS